MLDIALRTCSLLICIVHDRELGMSAALSGPQVAAVAAGVRPCVRLSCVSVSI
jgi:hypothetical protein